MLPVSSNTFSSPIAPSPTISFFPSQGPSQYSHRLSPRSPPNTTFSAFPASSIALKPQPWSQVCLGVLPPPISVSNLPYSFALLGQQTFTERLLRDLMQIYLWRDKVSVFTGLKRLTVYLGGKRDSKDLTLRIITFFHLSLNLVTFLWRVFFLLSMLILHYLLQSSTTPMLTITLPLKFSSSCSGPAS